MPAFQIVVEKRQPGATSFPFPSLRGPKGLVDLLVDGANLTARLGQAEVVPLLRDLAFAIADLAEGRRSRASISCLGGDEPWQLGVEKAGSLALLSLFRAGEAPEVAVFERPVAGAELLRGTLEAIDRTAIAEPEGACELQLARQALAECVWPERATPQTSLCEVGSGEPMPLGFSATLCLRDCEPIARESSVERSDLLGLLARGHLRLHVGETTRQLGQTFVCLVAERLVELSGQLLDAFEQGRAFYRRLTVGGIALAARLDAPKEPSIQPTIWLTIGGQHEDRDRRAQTFPQIEVQALVRASIDFVEALGSELVRHDPSHRHNLRLSQLREAACDLDERLHELLREDVKLNPSPESYRAFAALSKRREAPARAPSRLRFLPRWTAEVPGIELGSTFLCGDRLIVGSARETVCLDRVSGQVLWQVPTTRAISVVTPAGLARIGMDGGIEVHDFGTGEVTRRLKIAPRVGGTTAGATVNAPGLPRLLIVTEGERHLSAIDLASGEIRFRHTARKASAFRIRRAGRLLVVASGDATLCALDLTTGDVVWRIHDRLRFATICTLDGDSLFAIAGDPSLGGGGRLYHLDAYAGTSHWVRELPPDVVPSGPVLVAGDVVAVVSRGPRGDGLVAFDRAHGELRFLHEPGLAAPSSAWLVVDDLLVSNAADGVLMATEAATGKPRYRHALRKDDGEEPRRLEPILRSGALFVPQSTVHVIRPRDGEQLGTVPCDLVPDLLRVDEACAVYVAEESGHVGAFEAGPRLTLVKG